MNLRHTIREMASMVWLNRRIAIPLSVVLFFSVLYGFIFWIHKPVMFSYAEKTCVPQVTILPDIHKTTEADGYKLTFENKLASLVSTRVCFVPQKPPVEGTKSIKSAPFGGLLAQKTFSLSVDAAPLVRSKSLDIPIAVSKPLQFTLSGADETFAYKLVVADKQSSCTSNKAVLQCPMLPLQLEQGEGYTVELQRYFNGAKVATLLTKQVTTLSAITVVNASLATGATVYDKPKEFVLTTDKRLVSADMRLEKLTGDTWNRVASQTTTKEETATLSITADLERGASYRLTADDIRAIDGSSLIEPYTIQFAVSDGPKVSKVSIDSYGVGTSAVAVVTFDQDISQNQQIQTIASLSGGTAVVGRTTNQITFSLQNLPKCTNFSLTIGKGLLSKYDIPGSTAWSFSSRTICHTVSTYGYSVRGKPLNAYYFGTGATTILYTGSIHGNEYSARSLMDAWINELERNIGNIPTDRRIVVIPLINPDGANVGTRNNAHNVDLNRNFDVSDWKSDITSPTGTPIISGGGATTMSEPETKAIAALTSQLRPRLTMSYHSVAGYAIGNMARDSAALAATYAKMTGYANQTGNSSSAFTYQISGTYDDWIAEKLGLPSVLVELSSSTNAEFSRNASAMWTMLRS